MLVPDRAYMSGNSSGSGSAPFTQAERVVWAMHPVWGPWLHAGWGLDELQVAERWRRRGWDPSAALMWYRHGFVEPRIAARYVDMGWRPAVCRVVIHLGRMHGLGPGSEARLLDSGAEALIDALHHEMHEQDNGDLFEHEIRRDAATYSLAIGVDGEISIDRHDLS